jgi:hypothetical protein
MCDSAACNLEKSRRVVEKHESRATIFIFFNTFNLTILLN